MCVLKLAWLAWLLAVALLGSAVSCRAEYKSFQVGTRIHVQLHTNIRPMVDSPTPRVFGIIYTSDQQQSLLFLYYLPSDFSRRGWTVWDGAGAVNIVREICHFRIIRWCGVGLAILFDWWNNGSVRHEDPWWAIWNTHNGSRLRASHDFNAKLGCYVQGWRMSAVLQPECRLRPHDHIAYGKPHCYIAINPDPRSERCSQGGYVILCELNRSLQFAGLASGESGINGDNHEGGELYEETRFIVQLACKTAIKIAEILITITMGLLCFALGLFVIQDEIPRQPNQQAARRVFIWGVALFGLGVLCALAFVHVIVFW